MLVITPSTSLFCYSSMFPTSHHHPLAAPFRPGILAPQFASKPLHICFSAASPLPAAVATTQQVPETATGSSGAGFVEVGYVASAHGIQGEICVKPSTDFPQLRFAEPGRRWMRQSIMGVDTVREVELVEGRGHPGQKSWIIKFEGVDTIEQARQLVGSTVLVKEDDRPELDDGEFYSRDLVGMRVILKETGECVGTVVNVYDTGASDLLHVMLNHSVAMPDGNSNSRPTETGRSGPLVWIPFVEAIVPDVDMNKREMWITPPQGLLQLNVRSDERSKQERRQLEWRERKKMQRRLIAAKKKLVEMEQTHVFDGLRFGEKSQRSLLAGEIIGVNSKLLRLALRNMETPSKRWNVAELIGAAKTKIIKDYVKISEDCLTAFANKENLGANYKLHKKGSNLLSKGKGAVILVMNDIKNKGEVDLIDTERSEDSAFSFLQKHLFDEQMFVKAEDRSSVPLVLICPVQEIESLKEMFFENDYFGFNSDKVWFLEEEKLPVVTSSIEEQKRHKILMKSPWEILESPVGSGGVISTLASHNILENLTDMGVDYIQVCSTSQKYAGGSSLLLGLVNSRKADVGIQVVQNAEDLEENFDMIFSMHFMKRLIKHIEELQFYAFSKPNSYVELSNNEWMEITPSSPNSYEIRSSVYSCLNACSFDRLCVIHVTE